jgi:nucleoside-diphosphate-sugar epimerase
MSAGRLALTGASGFIGRHVAVTLMEAGWDVVAVGRTRPSLPLDWRRADLTRSRDLAAVIHDCVAVVHFAANNSARLSPAAAAAAEPLNVSATRRLVTAAERARCRQFVFASTGKVYAPNSQAPFAETGEIRPVTPLAQHKRAGELALEAAVARTPRLSGSTLRIFNVYGPGQSEQFLIPRLLAASDGAAAVTSPWTVRDYLFVTDAAAAVATVLQTAEPGHRVLNVGSGLGVSIGDLVAAVARSTGRALRPHHDPRHDRAGEPEVEYADVQRLRALGWVPHVDLQLGIDRTVRAASPAAAIQLAAGIPS